MANLAMSDGSDRDAMDDLFLFDAAAAAAAELR
jgi:hypothetical protein